MNLFLKFAYSIAIAISLSLSFHGFAHGEMGQKEYATARTVRICAVHGSMSYKCGSGVFVKRNLILTALHVVDEFDNITRLPGSQLSVEHIVPDVVVLRSESNHFEKAVVVSTASDYDIALIRLPGVAPEVILDDYFYRGQKAIAIGNPMGRDFTAIETRITGIDLIQSPLGVKLLELISIDSKDDRITHGFSGGGLFTDRGMVGIIQLCDESSHTCLAMPTREIRKQIGELK
jgi:S1-C subfamily serine protease